MNGFANKIILTLLVLLVVFAVGCGQKVVVDQQSTPQTPSTATPAQPSEEVEVPVEEEPAEEETGPIVTKVPEANPDDYNWNAIPKAEQRQITSIRNVMDKAMGKNENYFYRYTGPDQYQYEYWVRGDRAKVQVLEPGNLDKLTTKNIVYLDREKKSAAWYCEHKNMNFCYAGPGPWPAVYSEFMRDTPKEWLVKLGQDFRYQFTDTINGVSYHIIDYTKDAKLIRVWIDSWDGYPLQIDFHPDLDAESKPSQTYKFEDMDFGGLSESDVIPQV